MRRDVDWDAVQVVHDSGNPMSGLIAKFGISYTAINTAVRHGWFQKRRIKRIWSEERKRAFSESKKQWLLSNPDRHLWRRKDKFKSIPCEALKKKLIDKGIVFVEEFMPLSNRLFRIDIALPEKKIGVEVNGNQHYDKHSGKLRPYYQERHDLIEGAGWKLVELHFTMVYCDEVVGLLIEDLMRSGMDVEVDPAKYEVLRRKRMEECRKIKEERIKEERMEYLCSGCGRKLSGRTQTGKCRVCLGVGRRKLRPSKVELEQMVNEIPMRRIGRQYGVSDNAVKKWCVGYGIELGCRMGMWTSAIRQGRLK